MVTAGSHDRIDWTKLHPTSKSLTFGTFPHHLKLQLSALHHFALQRVKEEQEKTRDMKWFKMSSRLLQQLMQVNDWN